MRIAVDLRSLSSGSISGVENYCLNLLENLLTEDKKNEYILFYNRFSKSNLPDFNFINSQIKLTKIPNKILNLALKLNFIKLEDLLGPFDCMFLPNLNQFNIKQNTKLAIIVHDLSPILTPEFYNLRRRLWHIFLNYKQAFDRADILFAVSEHTKSDLIKIFNISEYKIKVVYPGVDHKIFHTQIAEADLREARNVYGLPGKFILFLNTIEPRKNLSTLIKAFDSLDSDAHLVIAGRLGWKYKGDFNLIRLSKNSDKIKYIGYVEEKHKPALIKLASVLVYPSFYEGFGFQTLEAFGVGTPAAVSQLTALPEISGQAALLINPYDQNSLSSGLKALLYNSKLRQNLISKGLARAKQFSWQKTAREILSYI